MRTQLSLLLAVDFGLALIFILSCSGKDGVKGNDISNYATKQIGDQVWMAENLNYAVKGSKCYGEDGLVYNLETSAYDTTLSISEIQANCAQYGRLYDWATAMGLPSKCNSVISTSDADCAISTLHRGICPSGWHIPSNADWDKLYRFVGGASDSLMVGRYLKATNGWYDNGNGEDTHGFAAMPGGNGYSDARFRSIGYSGIWWSSSERDAYYAHRRYMHYYYEDAYRDNVNKGYHLFSVRCLKD